MTTDHVRVAKAVSWLPWTTSLRLPSLRRIVHTRDQLHMALSKAPWRIVVVGDEALRAYAARLAGHTEWESFQTAFGGFNGAFLATQPGVGRITVGRPRRAGSPIPADIIWRVQSRVRGRLVLARMRRPGT